MKELIEKKNDKIVTNNQINYSTLAGILLLIAGLLGLINYIISLSQFSLLAMSLVASLKQIGLEIKLSQAEQFYLICSSIGIPLSIITFLGSIPCFRKRMWGFAVGTAIIGIFSVGMLFTSSILCIFALLLLIKSKSDFN